MRNGPGPFLWALTGVFALGCSAEGYVRQADDEVAGILRRADEEILAAREATVLYPEQATGEEEDFEVLQGAGGGPEAGEGPAEPAAPSGDDRLEDPEGAGFDDAEAAEDEALVSAEDFVDPETWVIGLKEALEIAIRSNRDYQTQRESLYLTALSLTGTRFVYTPQLSATLAYIFTDGNDQSSTESATAGMSLSQILPTGGTLSIGAGTTAFDGAGLDSTFDSSASIRLTQPLLRGFGRFVAWNDLIQAERDLVYAVREFELFRYDFTIDVARRFYDLVNQKQSIDNVELNLEGFEFNRAQAEALFEVGRTNELDVLRARRSELTSRNDLIEAKQSYSLSLDQFKIFLGLDTTTKLDVASEAPDFTPLSYDVESAVSVALENRLDLMSRRQQVEDVVRNVRIARNNLTADLDLDVSYDRSTDVETTFGAQDFSRDGVTAALSYSLPVNRRLQRNAYRSTQISLARARRNLIQFEDNLVIAIRNRFRELTRREQSLEIQQQLIVDQQKNVRIAELRYEQGDFSNRDVVEARQSLLDAKNSLIDERVNYEITRLELLRDLGILFVDENGMWKV